MSSATPVAEPFRIALPGEGAKRSLVWAVRPMLERALRFPTMNRIYRQIHARPDDRQFCDRALEALGIEVRITLGDLGRIPSTGPVILIANHPMGGIDGLAMFSIMHRVRPDARMVGNYMMSILPDLREAYFFVDPFGGEQAVRRNTATMRRCFEWLRDGHVLATFPAGEVAHFRLSERAVVDPPWSDSVARMVRRTGASVVPIYFEGGNSALFHAAGIVHPRLRTIMLPSEMLGHRRRPINVRIGRAIPFERMRRYDDPESLTEYLRLRTSLLRSDEDESRPVPRAAAVAAPIEPPVPREALLDEIESLPDECRLLVHQNLRVYCAPHDAVPQVLREIGRLREIAFRGVGEGTGRSIDLDRFDRHYQHLFVWDRASSRILGAYRLVHIDKAIEAHGLEGLYTSTLFRFGARLIEQIGPCIELGRSFIDPEAQRSTPPLMLLWKGIGRFVLREPRYTGLVGPVSISAEYSTMSRLLLMAFLRMHRYLPRLGDLIRPRNPPRFLPPREWESHRLSTVVSDLDEVDSLVRELEQDGKPMPVLLRQYLWLNARLLGFNVDPEFGNVLDGLMYVDLLQVDRRVMRRFMGQADADAFLSRHAAATRL